MNRYDSPQYYTTPYSCLFPYSKLGVGGTGSLTRMREPSSAESVESIRSLDLRLLCHERAEGLLDEEQPPWANVYGF
jgi:hypothetical protein